MYSRERLIEVLQDEIDHADFSTEQGQDESYRNVINNITEIFKECDDNTLDLHDIVETVNILNDLDFTLKKAYEYAIINLILD